MNVHYVEDDPQVNTVEQVEAEDRNDPSRVSPFGTFSISDDGASGRRPGHDVSRSAASSKPYDAAARGLQEFCEQIETGGLAGAVRPDERVNGAALHAQRNSVHGHEAGKLLREIMGFEDKIVTHDATAPLIEHIGRAG